MKKPKLEDLSLREKIGQLLMIKQLDIVKDLSANVEPHPFRKEEEIDAFMEKYQYGSVWAHGSARVAEEDVVNMTDYISQLNKAKAIEHKRWVEKIGRKIRLPQLIGVDCEYGSAQILCDGARIGTSLSLGAANDEKLAFELMASVARELKAAGANWRWAPVVDVYNRLCHQERIVSENIDTIIRINTAIIKGTQSEKVMATAKHFPGGDQYDFRDAHIAPTRMNVTLEEWEKLQCKIFQAMIDVGVMSIMVSHCAFPAADDEMKDGIYVPSSISKKIIQGLLREKMGFNGIVITDAIEMAGLTSYCGSHEEVLIRCINAGNDVLLGVFAHDAELVYNAVLDGRIPMERIDESCQRVLDAKEKIGLFDDEQEEYDINVECARTIAINKKVTEKSITLVRDTNNMIPLSKDKIKKVVIVSSTHVKEPEEIVKCMKEEFEKRGAEVVVATGSVGLGTLTDWVGEKDLIVYAGYLAMHNPMGLPSLYGEIVQTYAHAFIKGGEKSIGVSLGYPYMHIDQMANAKTFFNIYSPSSESQKAFVAALYGEIPIEGTSPVDIEPKMRTVYC